MQNPFYFNLARSLLAIMFIDSVVAHIADYEQVSAMLASKGMPLVTVMFPLSIICEIFGIVSLLSGVFYRQGLLLLLAFTFVSTLFFFPIWALEGVEQLLARQQFFKNFALIGCMVFLFSFADRPEAKFPVFKKQNTR